MAIQQVMILSHSRAAKFQAEPKNQPIYLIRIFDAPKMITVAPYAKLRHPEQFEIIKSYTFDDVSHLQEHDRFVLFQDKIAKQILTDFDNEGRDCQTLLVHCRAGISRSPAVAIALSEIFQLKTPEEIAEMKKQFSFYNKRVYSFLLKVSQEMAHSK
jgi:predicted protein tyrosine phosphatase